MSCEKCLDTLILLLNYAKPLESAVFEDTIFETNIGSHLGQCLPRGHRLLKRVVLYFACKFKTSLFAGFLGGLFGNPQETRAKVLASFCGAGQLPTSCTCPGGNTIPFPPQG